LAGYRQTIVEIAYLRKCPLALESIARRYARDGSDEIVRFDHRDRHAGASGRTGDTNAGVVAAKDQHVECLDTDRTYPNCYRRLQATVETSAIGLAIGAA
jgi:hypothetical protein